MVSAEWHATPLLSVQPSPATTRTPCTPSLQFPSNHACPRCHLTSPLHAALTGYRVQLKSLQGLGTVNKLGSVEEGVPSVRAASPLSGATSSGSLSTPCIRCITLKCITLEPLILACSHCVLHVQVLLLDS